MVLGLVAARSGGHLLGGGSHGRAAQGAAGKRGTGGGHAQQDATALKV